MSYQIKIEIEEDSPADRNIRTVSQANHLTHEQAALQLITGSLVDEESPAALIARVRAEKARRKAGITSPAPLTSDAEKLIGLLADAPEAAEAIRILAQERRNALYGK